MKIKLERHQRYSWPQEKDLMTEMIITGRIGNILHLPDQLTQRCV